MSKKTVAAIGAVLVAFAVSAYFIFLSPKSTEIRFSLSSHSIASHAQETVSGSINPADAGRVIAIEVRPSDGSWGEVARVATDAVGTFKATFPMTERGESYIRAIAASAGRQKEATASAQSVSVLDPTQIEAQIARFARSDRTMRIPGRVTPAAARTGLLHG